MFDLVHLAIRRAVEAYGADGKFNAACFSQEFSKLACVEDQMDGKVVEAILCGRDDVEQLAGGSHYQLIEQTGAGGKT